MWPVYEGVPGPKVADVPPFLLPALSSRTRGEEQVATQPPLSALPERDADAKGRGSGYFQGCLHKGSSGELQVEVRHTVRLVRRRF